MRKPYEGMLNILLFNWPQYVRAMLVALTLVVATMIIPLPRWLLILLYIGASGAVYFLVTSLVVSYVVYDHSPLYRWTWLKKLFTTEPQRIANIHAGFDESSEALRALFPHADLTVVDLYDPVRMSDPSIARARQYRPSKVPSIPGSSFTHKHMRCNFSPVCRPRVQNSSRKITSIR